MVTIFNALFAIILLYYGYKYAFVKGMVVAHPFNKGEVYMCNNDLSFMIFSVMTAMVFLGPLSLVKYGIWIGLMLMMSVRWVKKWDGVMTLYLIFIIWNLYTLTYTDYLFQGWMMIIKFCLPILYFWMGYNAIKEEMDLWTFLKRTVVYCVIYSFLIGGVSAKFFGPLYAFLNFTTGGLFISYAPLADFFAILIGVTFLMYIYTHDKIYIYAAGLLFLSTLLESVRTGLGASVIGLSLMYLLYKKGRAVPVVILFLGIFIASILFVPEVRDKMFGENAADVTLSNVQNAEIEMSGREYTWEMIMENCYFPNPTFGSGCGNALGWLKELRKDGGLSLIHSDWVQMMSESGNIGLALYILFGIAILFKTINVTWMYKNSKLITLFGGLTAGSFAAMFFCMAYDNVVTYAQQGYVLPFMLLGIFLKLLDMQQVGQIN